MKRINYLILLFFSICIIRCTKKNDAPSPEPLAAGETLTTNFNSIRFSPLKVIKPNGDYGSIIQDTAAFKQEGKPLDLDGDGKDDIFFVTYRNIGAFFGIRQAYFYTSESFTFHQASLKKNEIIGAQLNWYVKTKQPEKLGLPAGALAYTSYYHTTSQPFNKWESRSFLAVKKVEGKKVKFGWVELSVSDYDEITIYRFGMQR